MSLYGGMTYPGTSFVFDKIYNTKEEADAGLGTDGILIGRYIMVDETKLVYRVAYDSKTGYFYQYITDLKGYQKTAWSTF